MKLSIFVATPAISANLNPSHLWMQGENGFSRAVKNLKSVLIEEQPSEMWWA